ncbi:MAG TPA: hypothetical protein PLT99_05920 [Chitinophagales bacterium]|nr:hypothetical protein [Chitinophagales bacterium]HNJ88994.1 hypothetical protein [Chitinophagales bacterium]HNM28242.1 hypothetical protein [Chitinophagales bacterium]
MKGIMSAFLIVFGSLQAGATEVLEDTSFQRTNPKLLYTTRDYFVNIPDNCMSDELCVKDFSFILTFNVGINTAQEIKQIGFKEADLDFMGKTAAAQTYKPHTFTKYTSSSTNNGYSFTIDFIPDKAEGKMPVIEKFVFSGTITSGNLSGIMRFQTKNGVVEVPLN